MDSLTFPEDFKVKTVSEFCAETKSGSTPSVSIMNTGKTERFLGSNLARCITISLCRQKNILPRWD